MASTQGHLVGECLNSLERRVVDRHGQLMLLIDLDSPLTVKELRYAISYMLWLSRVEHLSKEHLNAQGVPQWPAFSGPDPFPVFSAVLPPTVMKKTAGNVTRLHWGLVWYQVFVTVRHQ